MTLAILMTDSKYFPKGKTLNEIFPTFQIKFIREYRKKIDFFLKFDYKIEIIYAWSSLMLTFSKLKYAGEFLKCGLS